MNSQRGSATVVLLVVLVVMLAGGLTYFAFFKKPGEVVVSPTPTATKVAKTATPTPTKTASPTPSLPTTCVDQQEGIPVITSLSSHSGPVGTKLEIRGCNFSGFEGDKNAWIKNNQDILGLLRGEAGSTSKLLKVTLKSPLCQGDISYSGLPCDAWLTLTPGVYKIYVIPWGKKSNEATFTIK